MGTLLKAACLFLLLQASACVGDRDTDGDGSRIVVGDAIPQFTLSGPDGDLNSMDFLGRRGMIIFFASYCNDCRNTMGRIQQVWERFEGDDDYLIAPVSRQYGDDETPFSVAQYWAAESFTMPYYLDTDRELFNIFASENIPRIYIIDELGRVEWMAAGKPAESAEQLIGLLRLP